MSLTPLAVSVLSLLSQRPMHPYEMYSVMLERHEDELVKVRPGSLYHTVERLQRDGLVKSLGTDRPTGRNGPCTKSPRTVTTPCLNGCGPRWPSGSRNIRG